MFPTAGSLVASGDAILASEGAIATPSSIALSDIYLICLDIRKFIIYIFIVILIVAMYKLLSTAFRF